jgi:hypothetical protein
MSRGKFADAILDVYRSTFQRQPYEGLHNARRRVKGPQ